MKLLVTALCLVGFASAGSDMFGEKKMLYKWKKSKVIEGCYGKENFKLWMLKHKQAVAKCSDKDMPELDLPTIKSPFRFIKAFLEGAEMAQKDQMAELLGAKMAQPAAPFAYIPYPFMQQHQHNNEDNMFSAMMKKMMMKKMMKKMIKGKRPNMEEDDEEKDVFSFLFENSRKKREVSSDLGDRLTEKLKKTQEKYQKKIGMVKCVLREMNMIDDDLELNKEGMEACVDEYKFEDMWFVDHQKKDLDICYQMTQALPQISLDECSLGPQWAKIKAFFKCSEQRKYYTCMAKDAKEQLEENFGPLQDLVEKTNMKEEMVLMAAHGLLNSDDDE